MSTLQIDRRRHRSAEIGMPTRPNSTAGVGRDSQALATAFAPRNLTHTTSVTKRGSERGIPEQLFDALASFKIKTAAVAMYLDRDTRDRLFTQFDSLLAADDWDDADLPPSLASFQTFLRMLLFIKPARRPGLGATGDGKIIATWTVGTDKLTIECYPDDLIRWNLSVMIDDEHERAAALTPVSRLNAVLEPYGPARWFEYAE